MAACRVVDKAADDRLRELRVEARLEQGTPCPVMPPVLHGYPGGGSMAADARASEAVNMAVKAS